MSERDKMILIAIGVVVVLLIIIGVIGGKRNKKRKEADLAEKKKLKEQEETLKYQRDTEAYSKILSDANEYKNSGHLAESDIERIKEVISSRNLDPTTLRSRVESARNQNMRIERLVKSYGEDKANKILRGEFWIGMTPEQLVEIKGKPDKIETEVLKTKTKLVYVYGNKSSGDIFAFADGELERYKDR